MPLSISDPCSGTLHFCLEVKKSSDDVDPVTNVVNAAAASGNSPVSPDSKLQYLTKATLFPSGGVRRKVDSAEHNKIMSLARYDAHNLYLQIFLGSRTFLKNSDISGIYVLSTKLMTDLRNNAETKKQETLIQSSIF